MDGVLLSTAILATETAIAERDALKAAAELALEAMNQHGAPYLGHIEWYQQGIDALSEALS
jgi:hypothetical protein